MVSTDKVKSKFVLGKDVRQVLSYVETGNADAGIVYATDAHIASQVRIVSTAPDASHDPIIYPVAVLKDSRHQSEAIAFENYLMGQTAKEIFEKYGFTAAAE